MPEVADLWVTLRAITAPFTEALAASGAEADRFAEQLKLMETSASTLGARLTALGAEADRAGAGLKVASTEAKAAGTSMEASSMKVEGLGGKFLGLGPIFDKVSKLGSIGLAGIGIASVDMAMKFQSSTTRLVTSAGESVQNIGMVRDGLLSMAGQVGVSADNLANSLYFVEAAGYKAGDGLTVLRAAAQGAAAEGADTTTVAKALTDVLVDYHLKASDAANVTSQMITAVAHGKTNLQEFSGAFASIVPAASAAGISYQDVTAALAEMTNHGFTATRASQNLAQALRSMLNPTSTMKKAFDEYGVSGDVLKQKLAGPNGLTDAMQYLSQAATKAGPEGTTAFAAALKLLMGTAPGANAALATVGANYAATAATIAAVGSSTADATGKVQGFALVQQTLGQQLKEIRYGLDAVMIRIGDALIPHVSSLITLLETRGSPVVKKFSDDLKGIAQGFTGNTNPGADRGGKGQARGEAPPPLTSWQKTGEELKKFSDAAVKLASDLKSFALDTKTALENLSKAAEPLAKDLGGALLLALKTIGQILKDDVGPALVTVTQFMNDHKEAVKLLVEVALTPLLIRLAALAVLKPIGIIASLAKDIVTFPFGQLGQIWSAIQSGAQTASSVGSSISSAFDTGLLHAMYAWDGVKSGASSAWSFVTDKASSLKSTLSGAFDSASFRASYMWQGVKDGASTAWSWVSDKAGAMKDTLVSALNSGKTAALDLGGKIGDAVKAGGRAAWDGLVSGMQAVSTAAQAAGTWLATVATAALEGAVNAGKAAVAWVAEKVAIIAAAVSEGAMTAAQWLLNVAMDANPVGVIVGALGLLVSAFVLGWQNSQLFRTTVTTAFSDTTDLVLMATKALVGGVKEGTDEILTMAYDTVHVLAMIPGPTQDSMRSAEDSIKGFRDGVDQSFNGAIQKIDDWQTSVDSLPKQVVLQGNIDDLTNKINDAKNQLSDQNLPPGKRAILSADITDWQAKLASAKMALENEPDKKQAILTAQISDWLNGIDQAKQALSDGNLPPSKQVELRAEISDLQSKVDNANAALASVQSKTVSITASFQSRFLDAGQPFANGGIAHFADGGVLHAAGGMTVPGYAPRQDTVPAMLSPGEGVPVPEAVRALGGEQAITGMNRSARSGTSGMAIGVSSLAAAPSGGGGGGMTVIHHHHITHVHGSVLAERDLRDVMETQQLRVGANNSQTWQPYQRR